MTTENADAHASGDCPVDCNHPDHQIDGPLPDGFLTWLLEGELPKRYPDWATVACFRNEGGSMQCYVDGTPVVL